MKLYIDYQILKQKVIHNFSTITETALLLNNFQKYIKNEKRMDIHTEIYSVEFQSKA